MLVAAGDSQAADGVNLEVDLDEHGWLVADHPRVVPGRDVDGGGRDEVDPATVGVLDPERTVGEEADVGVRAPVRADERPEVGRPTHPGRVDRALDAAVADPDEVDFDGAEALVLGVRHRREQRVILHGREAERARRRGPAGGAGTTTVESESAAGLRRDSMRRWKPMTP